MTRLAPLLALAGLLAQVCAWPCFAGEEGVRRIAELEFPVERRVTFVELQMHRLLREPVEQRGVVWISADGAFVVRIKEPLVEERRLHQGELSLRRLPRGGVSDVDTALTQARRRTVKLDPDRPAHAAVAALADVLRGDMASLRRRFAIASVPSSNEEDGWVVELVSTDASLRKALGRVLLRGRGVHLTGLEVGHGRKRWRQMRFLDVVPSTSASRTP